MAISQRKYKILYIFTIIHLRFRPWTIKPDLGAMNFKNSDRELH